MKKRIFLIFVAQCFSLCSCSLFNVLSDDFFNNHKWTRWVSENGKDTIVVQGKNNFQFGYCAYQYGTEIYNTEVVLNNCMMNLDRISFSRVEWGIFLRGTYNYVGGKKSQNSFKVLYNNSEKVWHTYHAEKIAIDEIDLRYSVSNKISDDNGVISLWDPVYYKEDRQVATGTYNGVDVTADYGDNKTFTITAKDGKIASGTYTCTYEDATFDFETNEISSDSQLVLKYR